jgi:hypothetical protein
MCECSGEISGEVSSPGRRRATLALAEDVNMTAADTPASGSTPGSAASDVGRKNEC